MKNFRLLKYQTHDPLSENLMKILKNLTPLLKKPVFLEKNRYFAGNSTPRCPYASESARNGKSTLNYPRGSFFENF